VLGERDGVCVLSTRRFVEASRAGVRYGSPPSERSCEYGRSGSTRGRVAGGAGVRYTGGLPQTAHTDGVSSIQAHCSCRVYLFVSALSPLSLACSLCLSPCPPLILLQRKYQPLGLILEEVEDGNGAVVKGFTEGSNGQRLGVKIGEKLVACRCVCHRKKRPLPAARIA